MQKRTYRQISILYFLMMKADIATAEQLADFTSSSVRTIKSEMNALMQDLEEEGIVQIVSLLSKGYQLQVLRHELLDGFRQLINSEYVFYRNMGMDQAIRRIHILQRILSSSFVKLDELADELFLTKSAIKTDMAWVSEFLASYHIEIISKPNLGNYVKGKEEDLRMAMVETFCSQYYPIETGFEVAQFQEAFYKDPDFYQDIRHGMLKLLRESRYSMKDISTKKLSTYLVLIQNRVQQGHHLHLSAVQREGLQDTYEWQIANQIFALPGLYEPLQHLQDEVLYFTILLICHRDLDIMVKADQETAPKKLLAETMKGYETIMEHLRTDSATPFFRMELFDRFRSHLISSLYTVYVGAIYQQNEHEHLTTYYELTDFDVSPLSMHLAREFMMMAQQVFQTTVHSSIINRYQVLFELILKRINFDYKKRRLAIVSMAGRVVAREFKEYIQERFQSFTQYLDIFNLYEMRRINFDDYDTIIVDASGWGQNYPVKFVPSHILTLENSTIQLFEDAFMEGYSYEIIDHMKTITRVIPDFACTSASVLFKMLSFRYHHEQPSRLEDVLLQQEALSSFYRRPSMVAMIVLDEQICDEECIDIYTSENKMMWDQTNEVKYIIVVSLSNQLPMAQLKMVNKVLHNLYDQGKLCEAVCQDCEHAYLDLFKEIIRSHFLRK